MLVGKWSAVLATSLRATNTDPDGTGLLWSDPAMPTIGYGFQDAEIKVIST